MSDSPGVSRRDFVKALGTAAMVPALGANSAETPVARFYKSLTVEQKSQLSFPDDHPLRSVFRDNWKIVEPTIGDLDRDQQSLCRAIFQGLCTDAGLERFDRQMRDDYGGFANYHVALFGEPGTERPFEWVLTGRHVTLRADGNRMAGPGFGGPIFYGHSAAVGENVWSHHARGATAIFEGLDREQKTRAIVTRSQAKLARVALLRGENAPETGLAVSTLDDPGKRQVQALLQELTTSFRAFDAQEITSCLIAEGGADRLRLAFHDIGEALPPGALPVWTLSGPAFSWYFHGDPHVHAWVVVDRPT